LCDAKLISKMLDGDIYAANKLVKKHKKDLLGFITTKLFDTQLAEDCYQATWEKAFKMLHTFDQQRSFKAWIFKICQNAIYDELRRNSSKTRGQNAQNKYMLDIEYYETLLARQKTTEELAVDKELRAELLSAVFALPERLKDIVELRFFHCKTFGEVAQMLGMSESTVKYRQNKAISLLKRRLGDGWYV
jgi:RNA polymerase sigma factor (sigma-70 family)